MSSISFILILIPFFTVILAIPILIGVYVYRDANRRGMNAALWTLISILAPSLIGFIIFLLVRGNYSNLKCPRCETPVTEQYVVCPKCGAKLRPSCPNCSAPIETGWKVCPKCAGPLDECSYRDISVPVKPKDNTLWKILAIVLIVPILLIAIMVFSMTAYTSGGSSSLTTFTIDQYLTDMENEDIEKWLDSVGDDISKAYVLMHQTDFGDSKRIRYLIYFPRLVENPSYSFGVNTGLFGETFKIAFPNVNGNTGNTLVLATYNGDGDPRLKLYYDGKLVDCEITEVDYPIGLTDGSKYAQHESSIGAGMQGSLTITAQDEEVTP